MALRGNNSNPEKVVRVLLSFTHPRAVILTNNAVIPALGLMVLSIIFTVWPQALEHAAISFERRGVVHHIWHYSLLGGSLLAIYGMFSASRYRLYFEFFGLLLLVNALGMNLVAQLDTFQERGIAAVDEGVTGMGLAARIILLLILLLRMYVVYFEPKVVSPVTNVVLREAEEDDE